MEAGKGEKASFRSVPYNSTCSLKYIAELIYIYSKNDNTYWNGHLHLKSCLSFTSHYVGFFICFKLRMVLAEREVFVISPAIFVHKS